MVDTRGAVFDEEFEALSCSVSACNVGLGLEARALTRQHQYRS